MISLTPQGKSQLSSLVNSTGWMVIGLIIKSLIIQFLWNKAVTGFHPLVPDMSVAVAFGLTGIAALLMHRVADHAPTQTGLLIQMNSMLSQMATNQFYQNNEIINIIKPTDSDEPKIKSEESVDTTLQIGYNTDKSE